LALSEIESSSPLFSWKDGCTITTLEYFISGGVPLHIRKF
jgi:hypothetical protein